MNNFIKWDPVKELANIQSRLSSLFTRNHYGDLLDEDKALMSTADGAPAVDIAEDDDAYEITADLRMWTRTK